jgi:hypothetical protein
VGILTVFTISVPYPPPCPFDLQSALSVDDRADQTSEGGTIYHKYSNRTDFDGCDVVKL